MSEAESGHQLTERAFASYEAALREMDATVATVKAAQIKAAIAWEIYREAVDRETGS